jgi:hypothetical protein
MKWLDRLPPRSSTWADALDNCLCEVEIDLIHWHVYFDIGIDPANIDCQLAWFLLHIGPLRIALAIGH